MRSSSRFRSTRGRPIWAPRLEWANGRGLVRLGYDGSFFRNNISTLVWDNPLSGVGLADRGSLAGADGALAQQQHERREHDRGAQSARTQPRDGVLSVGNWSQNDPLIPFTINSALPAIPLDRTTADAKARGHGHELHVHVEADQHRCGSASRYRSYDFDNRTPVFHVANTRRV